MLLLEDLRHVLLRFALIERESRVAARRPIGSDDDRVRVVIDEEGAVASASAQVQTVRAPLPSMRASVDRRRFLHGFISVLRRTNGRHYNIRRYNL